MSPDAYESIFTQLTDISGVSKIGGGPVPLKDATGEMRLHLFINLTLINLDLSRDLGCMVDQLRKTAFDVFRRLRRKPEVTGFATVCISMFTPTSATEGLRIYRTRLATSDLQHLEMNTYKSMVTGEESGNRELHELLNLST